MKCESYLSSKEKNGDFFLPYKQIYNSVPDVSQPSNK